MSLGYIGIWEKTESWWWEEKILNIAELRFLSPMSKYYDYFTVQFRLCLHWVRPKGVTEEAWMSVL